MHDNLGVIGMWLCCPVGVEMHDKHQECGSPSSTYAAIKGHLLLVICCFGQWKSDLCLHGHARFIIDLVL